MNFLKGLILMACAGASSTFAATDDEVLREGVQDLCADYGGDYWDAGDGTFGCDIDDLDAEVLCVEGAGCTVFDPAASPQGRSPLGTAVVSEIASSGARLLANKPSAGVYCQRKIRDHRPGKPAERAQATICRKKGLVVGP